MDPSPAAKNRGAKPVAMVSNNVVVFGSMQESKFFSVLVTQTRSSEKITPNDPGLMLISAAILLVVGSIRANTPFLSLHIQIDSAPTAIPPSELAMAVLIVAVTFPLLRLTRTTALSPQQGTQRLPKPMASPHAGFFPTAMTSLTVFVTGSSRATVPLGALETQVCSPTAIQ